MAESNQGGLQGPLRKASCYLEKLRLKGECYIIGAYSLRPRRQRWWISVSQASLIYIENSRPARVMDLIISSSNNRKVIDPRF